MNQRVARIAWWSGLGMALVVTAYLLVNTTFMPYDDEGYVLISIRNYLSGLRLYDDVFSQYGPWPFVYHELITGMLRTDLTHSLGRALTVFHWVATALLCGGLSWRLTRSQLAAVVSALLVFGLCWQNTSEPSHPGSHISLLVALAAFLVCTLPDTRRPVAVYASLGIILGLLLLTKINVGLLLAAGLGCFVLRYTPWTEKWHRAALLVAGAGLLALPWVLIGRQLGRPAMLCLAIQFTLAAAGFLWVTPAGRPGAGLPRRAWLAVMVAALATLCVVCFHVWQHGTRAATLLDAILVSPLRMPANFVVALIWYPEAWLLAGLGAAAVFQAGREIRAEGRPNRFSLWAVTGLRAITLAIFVLHCREWPSYFGIFHFAAYCLPLLPVFLVPLAKTTDGPRSLARWGVAAVALPQVLHVFPVAGSQMAWATFLCVPLLVAGVFDLGAVVPQLLPRTGRPLIRIGAILLLVATAGQFGLLVHTGWLRYTQSRPLDLPGAGDIRLDGRTRQTFRLLNLNAVVHADLLFSRQGMFSHNIWSGIPTPTAQNATHWFWLLNDARQKEIAARLAATPRTALITSHSLDEFMVKEGIPVTGPLQDFLQGHYRPLFAYGDFTFHVPAGSRAAVFGRYEILTDETDAHTVLFRSRVLLDGRPAQIRLEMMSHPWADGPELLTGQSRAVAEPIDREDRVIGEAVSLPSARPLRGLYRLSVICPALPPKLPWQNYVLAVREADGRLLSESVY